MGCRVWAFERWKKKGDLPAGDDKASPAACPFPPWGLCPGTAPVSGAPAGLLPWCLEQLPAAPGAALAPLAGDASFRRYFRLSWDGGTAVACVAPPATEKNAEFLAVREQFADAGVRVPDLLGADLERGYLLLEDLGDALLLPALDRDSVDGWYRQAMG
ncbi:MAG TPA: hypothetical protein DD491_10730, partial [Halieaceae bacterium]|nr:hypothetical protein [Halieaceae bacterium]